MLELGLDVLLIGAQNFLRHHSKVMIWSLSARRFFCNIIARFRFWLSRCEVPLADFFLVLRQGLNLVLVGAQNFLRHHSKVMIWSLSARRFFCNIIARSGF